MTKTLTQTDNFLEDVEIHQLYLKHRKKSIDEILQIFQYPEIVLAFIYYKMQQEYYLWGQLREIFFALVEKEGYMVQEYMIDHNQFMKEPYEQLLSKYQTHKMIFSKRYRYRFKDEELFQNVLPTDEVGLIKDIPKFVMHQDMILNALSKYSF
jgi:hypothetical protein